MKHWQRFLLIFGVFLASIIIMNITPKSSSQLPYQGFRVACLPARKGKEADHHLIPYAQIAHTTFANETAKAPIRCYFRFSAHDIVCVPKSVAIRQGIKKCPTFPSIEASTAKTCYILNNKHIQLITLLKKKPPANLNQYTTRRKLLVNTWQEVRDMLLANEPPSIQTE